jgi:hypothetical protein
MFHAITQNINKQFRYLANLYKFYPQYPLGPMVDKSQYIDCQDLDPYDVLRHLYNSTKPRGLGAIQGKYLPMDYQEARHLLDNQQVFDHIYGRPIKTSFKSWPYLHPAQYDRSNAPLTMSSLISELKKTGIVSLSVPEYVDPLTEIKRINSETDQGTLILNKKVYDI